MGFVRHGFLLQLLILQMLSCNDSDFLGNQSSTSTINGNGLNDDVSEIEVSGEPQEVQQTIDEKPENVDSKLQAEVPKPTSEPEATTRPTAVPTAEPTAAPTPVPTPTPQPVDLSITINSAINTIALNRNCVGLKVNEALEQELACNDDDTNRTEAFRLLSKPGCNALSFSLRSVAPAGTSTVISTSNASSVRVEDNDMENLANFRGFKFHVLANGDLLGMVNDNGDDNNLSDMTFTIRGLERVDYGIENTSLNCP
jgi:hypothetical protein